jgi:hypothetical protein
MDGPSNERCMKLLIPGSNGGDLISASIEFAGLRGKTILDLVISMTYQNRKVGHLQLDLHEAGLLQFRIAGRADSSL